MSAIQQGPQVPGLLIPSKSRRATSGGAFRLHGDQLLYAVDFAVDEDDVRNLDRRPALARRCRPEVTGTEPQRRPEEIRTELLEVQPVGVKALRTAADKVLYGHLPRPYAPIGQPVEYKEHHQPNDQQACRKHKIEAG